MGRKSLEYCAPQTRSAPPSVVHIERGAGGGVVVRVTYPPGKFREMMIEYAVGCCTLALFPLPFLWVFWRSFSGKHSILLLFPAIPAAVVIPLLVFHALRLARSVTFEADSGGITVRRYRRRREWVEHLPRERISDVRIGFSTGGRSRSKAWLVIAVEPWYRPNRRLLVDLGGDNLRWVAEALRAGIGLPPRSWP